MKCEKCGKNSDKLTPTLTTGANGFRKYKLCASCLDKLFGLVSKVNKKAVK